MDELNRLYDILKREGYYTKSFNDFQTQFSDTDYQSKVFDVVSRDGLYTKDKDSFLSKYSVKKKENGEEVSESSEQSSTSGEKKFEQWELDMFKHFDDNPESLKTASNIDVAKYNKYKGIHQSDSAEIGRDSEKIATKQAELQETLDVKDFENDEYFDSRIESGDSRFGVSLYNYSKSNIYKNNAVVKQKELIDNINSGTDSDYNAIIKSKTEEFNNRVDDIKSKYDFKNPTNEQELEAYNANVAELNREIASLSEKFQNDINADVQKYVDSKIDDVSNQYIAKEDEQIIDKMLSNIPDSYEGKKSMIDKIVMQMTIPYDGDDRVKAKDEIYDYVSSRVLFDEQDNPTSYAFKNQAELRLEKINSEIDELQAKVDAENKPVDRSALLGGQTYVSYQPQQTEDAKKLNDLKVARDFYNQTLSLPDAEEGKKVGNFRDAFTPMAIADIVTAGFAGVAEIMAVLNKVNKGKEATDSDKEVLNAYSLLQGAKGNVQENLTLWAKTGQTVAQSLPFVTSIALSGGSASALKAGIKKMLKWELKKGLVNSLKAQAGNIAAAAARVPYYGGFYKNLAERRKDVGMKYDPVTGQFASDVKDSEKSFVADATKQYLTTFTEFYAEELGSSFAPYVGSVANSVAKRLGFKGISNRALQAVSKATKIDDPITEYLEEVVTGVMQIGIGEQDPKEFFTLQTQWETLFATTVMSGAPQIVLAPFTTNKEGLERHFNKKQIAYIEDILSIEDVSEKSKKLTQFSYDNDLSNEAILELADYSWKKEKEQAEGIANEEIVDVKTKAEEDKAATEGKTRVELPPELVEKEAVFEEADKRQEILPSERTVRVKHGTTSLTADKIADSGFAFEGLTGEERLSSATEGDGIYATRANALSPTFDMGADALMPEYSDYLEFDVSTENALFPTRENEAKYGEQVTWNEGGTLQRIKNDGYNVLILNTPDEGGRQIIVLDKSAIVSNIDRVNRFDKIEEIDGRETAIKKANEIIDTYESAAKNVIIEKNRQQYEAVVNSAKDYIDRVGEPRITLEEETKDDEKEMQKQQVQEQDEKRQTEKPTEEVEVSETGTETRQEDVVQEEIDTGEGDGLLEPVFKRGKQWNRKRVDDIKGMFANGEVSIDDIETQAEVLTSPQLKQDYTVAAYEIKSGKEYSHKMNAGQEQYVEYEPAEIPQPTAEAQTQQKGTITPSEEKVAEKRPKPVQTKIDFDTEKKIEKSTDIKPKNLRDVFKAGREIFNLNRSQALAQAIIVDRVIGKIAKRRGVSKKRIYDTVEFKKSKIEDLTPESRNLYQAVWHGSPHAFEKFTLDKIGTGEGAQAFGWGLYFTDSEDVANHYAKAFVPATAIINGKEYELDEIDDYSENGYTIDAIYDLMGGTSKSDVVSKLEGIKEFAKSEIVKEVDEAISWVEDNDVESRRKGNLYKVKLHGDRAIDDFNYLDWYESLTDKQIDLINKQLVKEGITDKKGNPILAYQNESIDDILEGKEKRVPRKVADFYEVLSEEMGSDKEASLFLLRAGIDGIKYPTESLSGKKATEEQNYVIFDENVAEIEEHIKFQKGQGAKGAIQFLEDGSAIIHALTDPNVSTPLHEIAHLYEKYMTKSERDAVLRWAKQKEWNTETSEKFARGFEKYLAEGKAPNAELKRVFNRFKEWLTDIYNGITGSEIDIELNDEMRSVYSAMLGEGVVRPKKAKKVEYKETFDDVDGLLFQDGTLYQGEDVTKRHTEAVNKLIDNYEKQGRKDIDKAVRDYLEERGNPVSEQIINNVLKERGYAKEQPSSKVQKKGTEKREEQKERDKDLSKGDRSKLQDGKKAEKPKEEKIVGGKYKSSRFGVRYAFGEGFTEEAKEAYRQGELYKYKPESQQEIVDVAEVLFNTNDNEGVEAIFKNKDVPKRVRVALGTLMARNYSNEAENALREGNTEQGDKMIDLEQATIQEMQRIGTELGKDLAFYGSELVMDNFTPYKTARIVERKMNDQADKVRKSKDYKRAKTVVQDELQKLRPSVMKAVGKQKKVQDAKKKAKRKSETDPRKAKIRKEISDLTDMLRATRGSSASMSVIGLSNEQIEIGGKIAAKYVELGIINVKELITKLKKEFGKAGIEITEDEAKRMIPEKDGKTVDELEKEQALEAAAEKLAQEEFGYVADRRAPKYDPIAQMVRTLTSKFRERAKEGERPAPRSNMDVIKEAILNKADYMEVWTEARQSAMDLIDEMVADEKITEQQAEKYREEVDKSYQNATTFSVSEKRIQQLIRESMAERDVSIDDVVRDHYERRELHKQELIDDLVKKSGLTNEAAKELAEVIDNAFQTLMAQKGEALIKKYLKKKEVKPKKAGAKSPVAELIELVNIGALNSPEFDTIFEEMYGVPKLTDEQRNEIVRRGKKIQKIKAADVRHKEEQKLMSYVMDLEGVNAAEILTAFWYAHVLSGVATHIRNISDAYVSSYLEILNLAGFDPKLMRQMIKAHRRGMKYEGRQRFLETMKTGFTPLAKKLEIPSALERIKFEPKDDRFSSKVMSKVANMYKNIFRYVPRALSGTDSYIYAGAKESAAYVVRYRRERQRLEDEKGRKLTRAEKDVLRKHVNDLLYVDEASMNRFKAVVEQESEDYKQIQKDFGEEPTGYNEREKKLRMFELIDQERGLEVTDTAFDIAGRAIGNIKTYGMLGAVVDGISRFLRKVHFTIGKPNFTIRNGKPSLTFDQTKQVTIRPLGLVIPFTRIVANVATRNLGWNMYVGAMRAGTKSFGKLLGKDSSYFMEMSPEEKKVAWQKIVKVGIIHMILAMLTQPDDDGDSFITITFDGTGNYEKNKQLEQSGWKPYSIQIGNKSMSYLPLGGLAMILAPIGYMRDKQKYTDTELNGLELYAKGNFFAIGHVIKSTPVYAINKVFEMVNSLMTGDEDKFLKKLSQTAGSMGTGFVSPKAVSDIINFMGVILEDPREKPETAIARALQYVPIVDLDEGRIHYNVFGEPIPKNMSVSQIVDVAKQDEDIQYYIEQGYFRPALEMGRTEFRLEDERGESVARTLNPRYKQEVDMFNKYEQEVGQAFKEAVTDLKEDGIEGEEFVEEMTKRWLAIVKAAKDNVRDYSFDYPVRYDKDAEIRD